MGEPLNYRVPIANPDGTPTDFFSRLWLALFRKPVFILSDSQDPPAKGNLVVQATSDTSLTFKYRGSDGVVRSGSITLT